MPAIFTRLWPHVRTDKTVSDNSWMDTVEQLFTSLEPLGPFGDDVAAAAGGVAIRQFYYNAAGIIHIRLT